MFQENSEILGIYIYIYQTWFAKQEEVFMKFLKQPPSPFLPLKIIFVDTFLLNFEY